MIEAREIEARPLGQHAWVDEIEDGLRFAAMRSEWGELCARAGAGPFLSWEWLYPWWRRLAFEARLHLFAARDKAGQLAGLLPLCEQTGRVAGVPVRRWGFLGDAKVGSDYLDLVAQPALAPQIVDLMVEQLSAKLGRIDVLELLDLPQGSVLADAVLRRLGPRCLSAERFERFVCPLVEIQGDYDAYLKTVGRADNLARRRKWFQAQPGYALERVEAREGLQEALIDFFHLHALRWSADGGSQGIDGPDVRAFHRDATALLAERGMLRFYTLKLSGRALASVYGIVSGERFYYYQSGYDPQWSRRSTGLVLLGETLADAHREGRAAFEFLRGSEPYKFEWSNARRHTEGVRLVTRSAGGAAWLASQRGTRALKARARSFVGDRAWAVAQRVKRRWRARG